MNYYYLKRTSDGRFVADSNKNPAGGSYTRYIDYAKKYRTREEAERDRCIENEFIVQY